MCSFSERPPPQVFLKLSVTAAAALVSRRGSLPQGGILESLHSYWNEAKREGIAACCGLTQPQAAQPYSAPHSLPPTRMGQRIRRAQVKKLAGENKHRLIGKGKGGRASKENEELIHHFPSACRCSARQTGINWCFLCTISSWQMVPVLLFLLSLSFTFLDFLFLKASAEFQGAHALNIYHRPLSYLGNCSGILTPLKTLEEHIVVLRAVRPIPVVYWLKLVWYITSSKGYLLEERSLKQLGHLCICVSSPSQ